MVRFYTYLEMYLEELTKSVSLSDFERHFNLPHQRAKRHLVGFVKANILKEEKKIRFRNYTLNLENPLIFVYLGICEKERLFVFLDKQKLFSRFYDLVAPYVGKSKILLFGSSVNEKHFQDIDLLIIDKNEKLIKEIKSFELTYSVKFHLIYNTENAKFTKAFLIELRKKHIIFNSFDYFMELLYSGN